MNSGSDRNRHQPTNAAQLRAKIDAGETGDKVAFPDPAAAPLGTDDEAGGASLTRRAISAAAARETSRGTPLAAPGKTGPWVWTMIATVLLVILAAAAAIYWPAA